MCGQIQLRAILRVGCIHLGDFLGFTYIIPCGGIHIRAVAERILANLVRQREHYTGISQMRLRARQIQPLVRPALTENAAHAACRKCAGHRNRSDSGNRHKAFAPQMTLACRCIVQCEFDARLHRIRCMQLICTLMQHFLDFTFHFDFIHD